MPHVIESTAEMPHFIQSCPWKGQKVPLILLRAGKVSKDSMHPCRQIMFSSSCRYQMVSYSCFTSPEPEMTQNSCPIRQRSSKSYEILLSKPFTSKDEFYLNENWKNSLHTEGFALDLSSVSLWKGGPGQLGNDHTWYF